MKEFVDKLIGRLEELRTCSDYGTCNHCQGSWCFMELLPADDVIEIINELAEKYNNGWIPCSERLPEKATTYEVTKEIFINSKKQYIVDHCLFGTEGEWICSPKEKVIAWQPLPEPYKEVGAE